MTQYFTKPCVNKISHDFATKILVHEYQNFQKWCTKWKLVINPTKNEWTRFHYPKKNIIIAKEIVKDANAPLPLGPNPRTIIQDYRNLIDEQLNNSFLDEKAIED